MGDVHSIRSSYRCTCINGPANTARQHQVQLTTTTRRQQQQLCTRHRPLRLAKQQSASRNTQGQPRSTMLKRQRSSSWDQLVSRSPEQHTPRTTPKGTKEHERLASAVVGPHALTIQRQPKAARLQRISGCREVTLDTLLDTDILDLVFSFLPASSLRSASEVCLCWCVLRLAPRTSHFAPVAPCTLHHLHRADLPCSPLQVRGRGSGEALARRVLPAVR
jgi:hypothetical protein